MSAPAPDAAWEAGVAAVRDYAAAHGHARVPRDYISPDGHRTGTWVSSRRREFSMGTLSGARIAELESIPGWVWNPLDEQWSGGVVAVRAYAAENGHANVPKSYVSPNGHRTGAWVSNRRADYAAAKLSAERIAELEALPGWVWTDDSRLVIGVAAVRAYAAENGHARVPASYVSPHGHKTGSWVRVRRQDYVAGKLSADRIAELESIPGWVWGAR